MSSIGIIFLLGIIIPCVVVWKLAFHNPQQVIIPPTGPAITMPPWWTNYALAAVAITVAVLVGWSLYDPSWITSIQKLSYDTYIIFLLVAVFLSLVVIGVIKRSIKVLASAAGILGIIAFLGTTTISTMQKNIENVVAGNQKQEGNTDTSFSTSVIEVTSDVDAPPNKWGEEVEVPLGKHIEFGNASLKDVLAVQYRVPGTKKWKTYTLGTSPEMTGVRFKSLIPSTIEVQYAISDL